MDRVGNAPARSRGLPVAGQRVVRHPLQLVLDLFAGAGEPAPGRPVPHPSVRPQAPAGATDAAPAHPLAAGARVEFRHPRANREALLEHSLVAYEFKRARRRTIGFVVDADGLVVRAPRWVRVADVDAAVREKAGWIVRKLAEARERGQRLAGAAIAWKEGASLPFLGEPVILVLDPRHAFQGVGGALQDGSLPVLHADAQTLPGVPGLTLHLALPHDAGESQIRDAVQAWLMRQARRVFVERLDHFAPRLGVRWRKLSLSSAGTRWGSASADGAIRLNWRLVHFRLPVIDYVVAHELSHLRVMDHSARFWDTVATVVPDYAELRGQLKDEAIPRW